MAHWSVTTVWLLPRHSVQHSSSPSGWEPWLSPAFNKLYPGRYKAATHRVFEYMFYPELAETCLLELSQQNTIDWAA